MDTKQRYRRRLRLQAALSRAMQVLIHHIGDRIPPDQTTARLAAELVRGLNTFLEPTGVVPADLPPEIDTSRMRYINKTKKKETRARYLRKIKQVRRKQRGEALKGEKE